MHTFLSFWPETPFWANLVQNIKITCFNWNLVLKFGILTNSNIKNSIVLLTFSVFDRKYLFRATLVQKIKVVCFNWNLVLKQTWSCSIQCGCSFILFLTGNIAFGKTWSQNSKIIFRMWNLGPRLIPMCRTVWYSLLLRSWPEITFLSKGSKNQNCQFKLKFGK